jgi:lipoate synthase
VPIDRSRSDLRAIESDNGSAEIRVVGDLTLDYVLVTCVARIDLATLQGEGHLEVR